MPRIVNQLTEAEKKIEQTLIKKFTEEQLCAYFLSKTIRSLYQFNNAFISDWYQEVFNKKPAQLETARCELTLSYANMLMLEKKYRFHLDYWIRQRQENLITEMALFFSGEPGK